MADRWHVLPGRRTGANLDLDVFAMEPVTCRWVRAQLTVAQDLFARCVVGLRVTPVSTKAVDVAGVLYEAVAGRPAPRSWPAEAVWPYHGVPAHVVFDEKDSPAGPVWWRRGGSWT